jgi:DNA repair protein RadC
MNENPRPELLTDVEFLEFLLHSANPKRNSLRLSRILIERFGSFAGVVAADCGVMEFGANYDDVWLLRKFAEIMLG